MYSYVLNIIFESHIFIIKTTLTILLECSILVH